MKLPPGFTMTIEPVSLGRIEHWRGTLRHSGQPVYVTLARRIQHLRRLLKQYAQQHASLYAVRLGAEVNPD